MEDSGVGLGVCRRGPRRGHPRVDAFSLREPRGMHHREERAHQPGPRRDAVFSAMTGYAIAYETSSAWIGVLAAGSPARLRRLPRLDLKFPRVTTSRSASR